MSQTLLYGNLIQTGSIPTTALGGGVISSSVQIAATLPLGLISSSTQLPPGTVSSSGQLDLAQAFGTTSFAATASNLTGGVTNYIPLWTSATQQSASSLYQTGSKIGINNIQPSASLHVSGDIMLQQVYERVNITTAAPPTTFNVDILSGSFFYRSASTAINWTLNFRGDATTPLNNIMYAGQALTSTVMTVQGGTPYSASTIQIDGRNIVPRWQGGVSSSTANGLEANTYTIIKLASASYDLLASVTRYV
jgi:hypothetical protein